jgi:hypothetical protein
MGDGVRGRSADSGEGAGDVSAYRVAAEREKPARDWGEVVFVVFKWSVGLVFAGFFVCAGVDCYQGGQAQRDAVARVSYEAAARTWMQQNNVPGVVSCPHKCDVVPSDGRGPFILNCWGLVCQLDQVSK